MKRVWYPGLESHPNHELAKKQMSCYSGMIAFEMMDMASAQRLVEVSHP